MDFFTDPASPFYDPTAARVFYGSLLIVATWLAWRSHDIALRQLSAWMWLDWIQTNLLYDMLGPDHAPWLVPGITAIIATNCGILAIKNRSHACWSVVSLFLVGGSVNLAAAYMDWSHGTHWQGSTVYYCALSATFLLRMAVVGGAGVVASRTARRDSRLRHRVLS